MDLRSYFRILRERWLIILAAFLATVAATAAFTFTQTPLYQATATFVVAPQKLSFADTDSLLDGLATLSRNAEIAGTYVEVANSLKIKQEASVALNLSNSQRESLSVDSQIRGGTTLIEITVEGEDPVVTQSFAVMIGERTTAFMQELYEAYEFIPIDPPLLPESPVRPNTMLNLTLGTALGLALGVGLAFLFEYLDITLQTTQEIEAAVEAPALAEIPVVPRRRRESTHCLNGDRRQAEAFLRLRTRILAQHQDTALQTVLVTSTGPGEGKSTVVARLAATMAHSGCKVAAVDADLRRPTLHEFFDLGNQQGLSDILEERASLDDVLQRTRVPGLRVLTSGRMSPRHIVDLLDSPRMEALLQQLGEEYDVVLLDTPAWLSVTDAAVLASVTDGVVLVVGCAQATETALRTVRQEIADVKARFAGVIVNRVQRGCTYYYEYPAQPESLHTRDSSTRASGIGRAYERALSKLGLATSKQVANRQKDRDRPQTDDNGDRPAQPELGLSRSYSRPRRKPHEAKHEDQGAKS